MTFRFLHPLPIDIISDLTLDHSVACPTCNAIYTTSVINSRTIGLTIRRRRKCRCGTRWSTLEVRAPNPEIARHE